MMIEHVKTNGLFLLLVGSLLCLSGHVAALDHAVSANATHNNQIAANRLSAAPADERGIYLVKNTNAEKATEERLALVIGNSRYATVSTLANPENDAEDITATLRRLGFTVTVLKNASHRAMKQAIIEFGKRLNQGKGVGLFYYAGHGMQAEGKNYLLPVDAKINKAPDIEFESVNVALVLNEMHFANNRLNMVILDACRDNPFARSFRSVTRGLAQIDAPSGTLLAYATAPGNVAADGHGRNGTYTKYLLSHLDRPGLKVEEVFKAVREDVMNETNKLQVPWESSSLVGDFYFVAQNNIKNRPNNQTGSAVITAKPPLPQKDLCRQTDIDKRPISCLFRGL